MAFNATWFRVKFCAFLGTGAFIANCKLFYSNKNSIPDHTRGYDKIHPLQLGPTLCVFLVLYNVITMIGKLQSVSPSLSFSRTT